MNKNIEKENEKKFKNNLINKALFIIAVLAISVTVILAISVTTIKIYKNETSFESQLQKEFTSYQIVDKNAKISFAKVIDGAEVRFALVTLDKKVDDIKIFSNLVILKTFQKDNVYNLCIVKTGEFSKEDTIKITSNEGEVLIDTITMAENSEKNVIKSNINIAINSKLNDPILVKTKLKIK